MEPGVDFLDVVSRVQEIDAYRVSGGNEDIQTGLVEAVLHDDNTAMPEIGKVVHQGLLIPQAGCRGHACL
jgi:hypothetical protein